MTSTSTATLEAAIPSLLRDPDLLLPLRIDITAQGARFVDSLCMRADSSAYDVWDLAWQTCVDSNLPSLFHWRIYLQLHEQIIAYRELISAFMEVRDLPLPAYPPLPAPQHIALAFRNGSVEYSEKVLWDVQSQTLSPESFARTTCSDLGLPPAMEPAIAFRLREAVMRTFLSWFEAAGTGVSPTNMGAANVTMDAEEYPVSTPSTSDSQLESPVQTAAAPETTTNASAAQAGARISLLSPAAAAEMVVGLWRRARPAMGAAEEQMTIPHSRLPRRNESNAFVYSGIGSGVGKSVPNS